MAYPVHPRHQAAREALEFQAGQQPAEPFDPMQDVRRKEHSLHQQRREMPQPAAVEEPREPAMGDAPPIPEVRMERATPAPGEPNLTGKSTEELQEGRRRLMARLMEEPAGQQFESYQRLLDNIDREIQMRGGG